MSRFRNIELFVAVARAGGFRVGAEALKLPNSTVSRRIAEMERELGLRLFNRTTRRVEMTESGRIYFERCQALMEEAEAAHAELMQEAESPGGLIRASMPVDFAVDRITAIISNFLTLYPRITFDLDISPRRADLIADPVDFVIRIGQPARSGLIQRKLTEVRIGLFATPAYLAGRPPLQHPADLADHSVLTMHGRELGMTRICDGATFIAQPQSPVVMNNVTWLRRFALEGLGIVALPSDAHSPEIASGQIVPVLPGWALPPQHVYILTESRLLPARVRVFLDYLIKNIDSGAGSPQAAPGARNSLFPAPAGL